MRLFMLRNVEALNPAINTFLPLPSGPFHTGPALRFSMPLRRLQYLLTFMSSSQPSASGGIWAGSIELLGRYWQILMSARTDGSPKNY